MRVLGWGARGSKLGGEGEGWGEGTERGRASEGRGGRSIGLKPTGRSLLFGTPRSRLATASSLAPSKPYFLS